ncbi:MAG: hypothetical protein IPO36_00425 [Anaerolineales bacterium]|nr:hypothetical protein [Anaerolineales bacterium]
MDIVKKIPRWEQIIPVYAVIVMMVYVWSLFQYFWRLSSWLNFSTLGQVGGIYVYTAAVNFIESLLILFALLVLSVILPSKWFYEQFVVKGSVLTLSHPRRVDALQPDLVRGYPASFDIASETSGFCGCRCSFDLSVRPNWFLEKNDGRTCESHDRVSVYLDADHSDFGFGFAGAKHFLSLHCPSHKKGK